MKKLCFILCLFCFWQSQAQSIETEFWGTLKETDSASLFEAKQIFHVKKWKSKELELEIKNAPFFYSIVSPFFFSNMQIFIKKSSDNDWIKFDDFSFNGVSLKCNTPHKDFSIKIEYEHRNLFAFFHMEATIYMRFFLAQWGTAFFTYPDMKFSKIHLQSPLTYDIFSNLPYVLDSIDSFQHFSLLQIPTTEQTDVSFGFVNKRFYQKEKISNDNFSIELWKRDSLALSEDSSAYLAFPWETPKAKDLTSIEKIITTYKHFFKNDNFLSFKIIDLEFKTDSVTMGTSLNSYDSNICTILIDIDCWNDGTIEHEIIHNFMRVVPPKKDSAYFFFSESIPEYLSIALLHSDSAEDKIFQKKFETLEKKIFNDKSIFQTINNKIDEQAEYIIIYQKIPYLLYLFSKEVGKDKFLNAFQQFYFQVNKTNHINIELMEKIFKESGISDSQWKQFMQNISSTLK